MAKNEFDTKETASIVARIFDDVSFEEMLKTMSDPKIALYLAKAYKAGSEDGAKMVSDIYKEEINAIKEKYGIKKEEDDEQTA